MIWDLLCQVSEERAVYQNMRGNSAETFKGFYKQACDMASRVGVEPSGPRIAARQRQRSNIPAESPEEYYHRNLAIPLLDHVLSQLDSRFSGNYSY